MGLKVPGCRYRLMQLRIFEGSYNQRKPEGYFLSITYVDGFCQESLNKRTGSQTDRISQ